MHNSTPKENRKNTLSRFICSLLLVAMLLQIVSVCAFAVGVPELLGSSSSDGSSTSDGVSNIDLDEISEELKQEILASIRKDLLQRVDTYELSGPVGVILTFSDNSLIDEYGDSYSDKMTYAEFIKTSAAADHEAALKNNQAAVIERIENSGTVDKVVCTYTNLMDGAFVYTTFEDLEALCNVEGIERVMLSDTYLPQSAVENPVDVYGTGIFNSGSVSYTGKGTIVAILDTGCDYAHSAFTSYVVDSPLYDRDDIAGFLPGTKAFGLSGGDLEAREVYYGNLTGNKIVYGYDYADKDPDIMPLENSHGTHVAGIIAGKDTEITGVAIDAQLAIMKVFSDYEQGAEEGDILLALEDAIVLGVDAINMSLGSPCGFSKEYDPIDVEKNYKNKVYSDIETAGISLIVAASNDHSSAYGGEDGNTNKTDNPDSATVGSPSSFGVSMTVASIDGKKSQYMKANGEQVVFYKASLNAAAKEYDFFDMLGIKEGDKVTYDYVTVPGLGLAVNYAGIDVEGKIALVKRGDITFEEKVQYAQEAGAIAVIIYNNVYGDIMMTIGNHAKIPAVSIGRDEGEQLAEKESGTLEFTLENVAGPFMSDFSSWGPTPDLKLKPDITAHGGNITSAVVGGEYDEMSGTSMAAPNMCGITVLIRQYVKEKYPEYNSVQVRDLVNQLCMSTATIALDKNGAPYSPRKQGAGIADITKATTTPAYLSVEGNAKTKLELGDDPTRTGVYEMSLLVNNISSSAVSYRINSLVFTESVSTSDPEYVAEMAYMLSNSAEYSVEGGSLADGVVTVDGGSTAKVNIKITLSAEDKSYLNSTFENGMFVEGYITFDNTVEDGVDLNAPFLAFYGNWGDAPIFDLDYYEVETEAHDNSIDDDDKIKADYYATTPLGSYYYDYILPLGTYLYEMDEDKYSAIPATREHAAISYFDTSISGIYGVFAGLLRGAKEMTITMVDTTTGKIVWEQTQYNCAKAHYSGAPVPYASRFLVSTFDKESLTLLGSNNSKIEVTMSAKLDWEGGENISDTYSFSFYLDYEAPRVTEATYRTEYDKSREENRYYLDVMIYDNHYAMSCRPIIIYDIKNAEYDNTKTYSSLTEYPIPIYQKNIGEATKVTIELTDYIDIIKRSKNPNGVTLYIDDYAMNAGVCYVPFPESDNQDMQFAENEITLDIHDTFDLNEFFVDVEGEAVKSEYFQTLKWSSSNPAVVAIKDGKIEAMAPGYADIKVTADTWVTFTSTGKDQYDRETYKSSPIYKTIRVNVTNVENTENPESGDNVAIEDLKFISYDTLYAHNNDIHFSEIGRTGTTNYFDGNYSLAFYPGESIRLNYELEPWNLSSDRYQLTWSSTKPGVATVDDTGKVSAESEGRTTITLKITIDGKTSLIAARLSVEIKSEFIIENRKLVAYKGKGGVVEIPDDEGILYIGAYAFSHYKLDNKKWVEKDEDGYYDLDEKKTPLGNNTVTKVIIPEGVEAIEKHAFYNCTKLTEVVLPESCETIGAYSFYSCENLVYLNMENVNIIATEAFRDCTKLGSDPERVINLEGVYSIADYGFRNTALNNIKLNTLSRVGAGIFQSCTKLSNVTLGERTRISNEMFRGSAVANVTVYSDIIGDMAFYGCQSLTTVVLENAMTYIGKQAFYNCDKLSTVTMKDQVEEIAANAFYSCGALQQLTLPAGQITIGDKAFASSALNKITIQEGTVIKSMGDSIFNRNNSLTVELLEDSNYVQDGNAIYSKDGKTLLMVIPTASMTAFTVPAGVTHIADGAFSNISTLTTVSFASGSELEHIGSKAFASCANLQTVGLPSNLISIGSGAFKGASKLKTISLAKAYAIGESAFEGTAITNASIGTGLSETERATYGITVGVGAFKNCKSLATVTLGAGVTIEASAFAGSVVGNVYLDGDASIGYEAFKDCTSLVSFDFADVTGAIAARAFMNCEKLRSVIAHNITAIGDNCFTNCKMLETFQANKLVTIGAEAFANRVENGAGKEPSYNNLATKLTVLELPMVESVGARAFIGSVYITRINMPKVKTLGESAFSNCQSLRSAVFSSELTVLPTKVFEACLSLSVFDYTNIERIEAGALFLVPFNKNLVLPSVTHIGDMAFMEDKSHFIETLTAPNLIEIGYQAFIGCTSLKSIDAPKLQKIGDLAFAFTAISEFGIGEDLKEVGYDIFESDAKLEAFYAIVDGEKTYNAEFDGAMIKDGVLYTKEARGYTLKYYPIGKTDADFVVADDTVRIEAYAFMYNENLVKVTLPASLKYIGDYAFNNCKNLSTVVFRSYYAPVLEGSLMGTLVEINVDTVDKIPGFDILYKYDYEFALEGRIYYSLFYRHFKDTVGTENAQGLVAVLPDNNERYNGLAYKAFFEISEETSGVTAGKYAIAFTEAVNKLPENIDRFDKLLMDDAIVAYNALMLRTEEKPYVDASVYERFERLRVAYNANVVTAKIAHIFDVADNEYTFNIIKDARAAYLALTDAERELISNYDVLNTKIEELSALIGSELNFDLTYAEQQRPVDQPPENNVALIIIIIVASVLVLGGGAAAAIIILKKKKTSVSAAAEEQTVAVEEESGEPEQVSEAEETEESGDSAESSEEEGGEPEQPEDVAEEEETND